MRVRGAGANPNFHRAESTPEVARRPRRYNHTTGAVFVAFWGCGWWYEMVRCACYVHAAANVGQKTRVDLR